MNIQGKKVCVFGAGKSGIGAAALLLKVGAFPLIYDGNDKLKPEEVLKKIESPENIQVVTGEFSKKLMDKIDLVVLSPGVPMDLPVVKSIQDAGIPIWGEVELAYRFGSGILMAVTGTNGKTTTTTLLGEIMKNYHPETFVVGNIGVPYTKVAAKTTENSVTVAEISSFQLETVSTFHPKVSAITNITEDHMNRHHTMEEYIRVKERITCNQTPDDFCILNYEDQILRKFGETIKPKVIYFSSSRVLREGIYLDRGRIMYRDGQAEREVVDTADLKILGLHNYENVMTAAAMAICIGVPVECIQETVKSFKGVEHRIEYVTEKNRVAYYNDSKGTNPDAAIKGIQAMNRPTLLIGGGFDKQSSYDSWIREFDGRVKYLVLIGQTKEKIAKAARACSFPADKIILCEDLKEAVEKCALLALPGDAVLLSPACASWGQFDSYEQCGDKFKEYVREL